MSLRKCVLNLVMGFSVLTNAIIGLSWNGNEQISKSVCRQLVVATALTNHLESDMMHDASCDPGGFD